jgi:hypothetical protein
VKVDLGEGLVGKGLVPKSVKVMADYSRFQEKVSSMASGQQNWEKKLNEMLNSEKPKEVERVETRVSPVAKVGGSDFLIAFLITLLIIGILLIASYFFTL